MDAPPTVVSLDITVSVDSFQEDAKKILTKIKPDWSIDNMKFKIFTDGITNKLLGCYQEGNADDMVLVRVNGEGSDLIIDRLEEQETFRVLSNVGCAPPVYATFNNGMAYGFFPGSPLDEKSVRKPHIQKLVAEEMVNLHAVRGSYEDKFAKRQVKSQYQERTQSYLDTAPTHFDCPLKQAKFAEKIPSKDKLQEELNEVVKTLDALNMKAVFSHNDLLLKNIVYHEKTNILKFIDYEYSFYNYEGFDIGNHFAEYAGMEEIDYNLYPEKEEQMTWLRHYLEMRSKVQGQPGPVSDLDVEVLYVQVNKCACAAHFFWGIWALIQAQHSTIDFDYVEYSSVRLNEYFRRKKEFFPMTIPQV